MENNRLYQHFDLTLKMILKAMMKLVRLSAGGSGNLTMMKPPHLIVKVEVGSPPFNLDAFPEDLNLAQKWPLKGRSGEPAS